MGCIVFSILAGILVIVVDKILKDLCKEVIFLLKHLGKVKLYQLIDDGAAEQRFFVLSMTYWEIGSNSLIFSSPPVWTEKMSRLKLAMSDAPLFVRLS